MQDPFIDTTVDGHVHTRLCHHARGEMEDYVVSAIDRGLQKIVFLEHLEVGINYFESTWLTDADFDYYHAEGKRLQDKYKDTIAIGLGVEVGYNPGNLKQIRQKLARHAWDRIGISYHFFETNSRHLVSASPGRSFATTFWWLYQSMDSNDDKNVSTQLIKDSLIAAAKHLPMGFFTPNINLANVINLPDRMKRSIHDDSYITALTTCRLVVKRELLTHFCLPSLCFSVSKSLHLAVLKFSKASNLVEISCQKLCRKPPYLHLWLE